jgi:hypothetical protein
MGASGVAVMEWRRIGWDDIPSREEFEALTLELLRGGVSNSDRMRDAIRRKRKLILSIVTGEWNTSPTNKFVNEHAWVLEDLVVRDVIERVSAKEYRLIL